MSDFYYREVDANVRNAIQGTNTQSRIRRNAYVSIIGDGFSLPTSGGPAGFTDTYNPNNTGRPAAVLGDVEVSLQGEAGSLRKASVSFTCFDKTSFEAAEAALLKPGSSITVSYG